MVGHDPLSRYSEQLADIKAYCDHGCTVGNQIILLLCVLQMIRNGELRENRIPYSPFLLHHFNLTAEALGAPVNSRDVFHPYFHLHHCSFWHLEPRPGREKALEILHFLQDEQVVEETVLYAFLDKTLFSLSLLPENNQILQQALLRHYHEEQQQEERTALDTWSGCKPKNSGGGQCVDRNHREASIWHTKA